MVVENAVLSKAVVSGGVGTALAMGIGESEFIILFGTGALSATMSFFYDWAHRHPKQFGLKESSEVMKYILYGVCLTFVVFYLGVNHISQYIELPKTAWAMVAALAAGSAVTIVEWLTPLGATVISKILGRVK